MVREYQNGNQNGSASNHKRLMLRSSWQKTAYPILCFECILHFLHYVFGIVLVHAVVGLLLALFRGRSNHTNLIELGLGSHVFTAQSDVYMCLNKFTLQDRLGVEVALVGVTSSRKMLLNRDGVALESWEAEYESSAGPADLNEFSKVIGDLDSDAVVFDCTASEAASDYYNTWMKSGVHVITPNKKLHSGPLDRYNLVRKLQAEGAAHYFYEVWPAYGTPTDGLLPVARKSALASQILPIRLHKHRLNQSGSVRSVCLTVQ
jgi:hypothetical protein